jgi:membrane-bound lytic murein transglycosylase D
MILVLCAHPRICSEARAESDLFPLYPYLQPNVSFWKNVYSQYSSKQGVIHDKHNLNIIYGIIELEYPDQPGGRKINQRRIKWAKRKYKIILKKLARGASPAGPEEQRVADLFGPDAKQANFSKARKNIRCQVGQKDRFRAGVIRSGAYLKEIRQIFRYYGLPEDLAYLPHVESSFNPKAYSKFGAAGIWQFTRSTGKQYMKVGYTVDERRDPILSSHAAARLLKKNYDKFKNWPMAITAYNVGTNGMLRARRYKKTYKAIFLNYKSQIFKFASRNFYSEFLAAREVAIDYGQYFGQLELDLPVESTEVVLAGYVSLPELARHLDVDLEILRRLNPALRNSIFSGKKYVPSGYRLHLPTHVDKDWHSLIAELSPRIFKHYQKRSRFYTVRRGDTAGKIARRYRIKLRDLVAANNLDSAATIYVNQNLYIPLPGEEAPKGFSSISTLGRKKEKSGSRLLLSKAKNKRPDSINGSIYSDIRSVKNKEVILAPQLRQLEEEQKLKSSPLFAQFNPKSKQKYEVSSSSHPNLKEELFKEKSSSDRVDYKYKQAKEESVSQPLQAKPIAQKRQLKPDSAPVNQKLDTSTEKPAAEPSFRQPEDIKPPQGSSLFTDNWLARYQPQKIHINPTVVIGHLAVERVLNQKDIPIGIIRVEVEETLGHYAEWLKVTAREIRYLNGFSYGQMIHMDQQLKIPLHQITKEEFEEKRFEYHKELAEDFFSAYRVSSIQTYSIKTGDNIWTLSREEFELPLWLIKRYNTDVDFYKLIPSQELQIPVVEKVI